MNNRVGERLVERGAALLKTAAPPELAQYPPADALINDLLGNPHAFVIGCIADRQVKAEVAWRLPFELRERVGGFSFGHLQGLSERRLRNAVSRSPALHRFPDVIGKSIYAAIRRISNDFGGDASRIWTGSPSSAAVVLHFLGFKGVGPKIATMATNILARNFKIPMSDYYSVDVSVDVHLRRVFTRLGLIRPKAPIEEVVYAARALHPRFPGLMDFPAWEIGREWCRPKRPRCSECHMCDVCPFAASGGAG